MDKYSELIKSLDELIKSIENYRDIPGEGGTLVLRRSAEAIESLQSDLDDRQRLLDKALEDLATETDCKNCANLDHCSAHRVERNLAYGGCDKWQWRGAKVAVMAS